MPVIYLPDYIACQESISMLVLLESPQDLIVIRLRNYRLLETLMSKEKLTQIVTKIVEKITNFCNENVSTEFKIITNKDYIFITASNSLIKAKPRLKKHLHHLPIPVYISFQVAGGHGIIATILPALIQKLEYCDSYCPSPTNIQNDLIIKEYETLNLLKKALNNKTVNFAFQPIIDSLDGNIAYRECLMRIPNEDGQWISAGPAILLAEKNGMIDMVDDIVIDMATHELASAPDITLSVNISNIGILDEELLDKITRNFMNPDMAKRLIIEITETSVNDDVEKTVQFIETVRALGIRIAIDDFGVGVTSFKQLCAIKFDIIKIDGSLIQDIATNPYHSFIVESVVKLSKAIGARTVAEFVENGEVAKKLMNLEVDFMQGHFFAEAQNFRSWNK